MDLLQKMDETIIKRGTLVRYLRTACGFQSVRSKLPRTALYVGAKAPTAESP
jgi:hypothetical protein